MTAHSKELDSDRLRQLSGEIGRLANALSRLSIDPELDDSESEVAETAALPEVPVEQVIAVVRARRLRDRYFDADLFADPAWDMMLDLLEAELSGQRVAVSSLCSAAAVPATTALRWVKTMVEQGLFARRDDPLDGRRVYVELTPKTSRAIRHYFARVGNVPVI